MIEKKIQITFVIKWDKKADKPIVVVSGKWAFKMFQSYGLPLEWTIGEAKRRWNIGVDVEGFDEEFKKHQEISRKSANKKFGYENKSR